jgi:hypothetical protein
LLNAIFKNVIFQDQGFIVWILLTAIFLYQILLKLIGKNQITFTGTDFFKTSLRGIDLSGCMIGGIKISSDFYELKGSKLNSQQAIDIVRVFDIEIV